MAKGNLDETEKTNTITTKAGKLTTVGSIINKLNSLFRTQIYLVKVLLKMSVVNLDLLHKKQFLKIQSVSCEIKFARAHVRARSHMCDVRAKMVSKCACDVRACGRFMGVRRAIANSHVFGSNRPYFARFFSKKT